SARPWVAGGAGACADGGLLLGPERQDPRLLGTLFETNRKHAKYDPGRDLFGDAAISEGCEGCWHQGFRCGCEEAEGTAGRRHVRPGRQGAAKWPDGARSLSVRGQEAVRVQEAV